MVDKDSFRRLNDFAAYENCLTYTSRSNLEHLSSNPENEGTFMGFLRYISLLDPSDHRKF